MDFDKSLNRDSKHYMILLQSIRPVLIWNWDTELKSEIIRMLQIIPMELSNGYSDNYLQIKCDRNSFLVSTENHSQALTILALFINIMTSEKGKKYGGRKWEK